MSIINMIIFAVILVTVQIIAGLALMRAAMSRRFIRWYLKKVNDISQEIIDETNL